MSLPQRADFLVDSPAISAADRLALLSELSRRMWALTKRETPAYTRRTIPVKLTTLDEQ